MELLSWLGSQLPSFWNSFITFGLSFVVYILVFDHMKRRKRWKNYPPGPVSFPFVGNLLQVNFQCPRLKFGKIFSLQVGWKNLVVLNGFEAVKAALIQRSEDFADRPSFSLFDHMGHPFNPRFLINSAVGNVMCSITFGNRFEYNNEKFQRMLQLIEEAFNIGAGILSQVVHKILIVSKTQTSWLPGWHKETRDPGFTRDFIDAFLEEIEKAKMDPESTFNEDNLIFTVFDLFGAATETTTVTLCWALLYMLRYPDVQRRVHEEIDKVIGRDRSPKIEDQVNLPYTNAAIYETQRYCDVVFAGVPRMTYRDTQVQDFFIPKGTTVIAVLSSVLKDETVWEKPHEFYPEHFLDAAGQFVKREAFLPFSAGRRICLGEQLARKELFLFFTTLLQHFTFHIPEDHPRPQEDGHYVLIHSPDSYELCAIPR
uniref:Cytochrome P450 n=1 Tax=Chelonoidis abingdonii TaxID=106734 RepID=A0A8C0QSG0_CHEAB